MRKAVNILFLGGAKRVSMARMFKNAAGRLGLEAGIFSYELTAQVPVAAEATVIKGLRWSDASLMDHLHQVVTDNSIDIIIPFVDPAVEVAARFCASDLEAGCFTPCGHNAMTAMMFDKVAADAVFRDAGFPLPLQPDALPESGTVIAKPRFGSASKGIMTLDMQEYRKMAASPDAENYLFQEYVAGRKEFTVDCYVASDGRFVCAVLRERLEVTGGEVSSTVTVRDPEIETLSRSVLEKLELTGAVTIQFMRDVTGGCDSGRLMLMEINPRLGGGAVCSVHAGAALPEFILRDWMGERLQECTQWRDGVMICRYPQETVFENGVLSDR